MTNEQAQADRAKRIDEGVKALAAAKARRKLETDLAGRFAAIVRDWLSSTELATVRDRNRTRQAGVCHSHDFCDANVAMAEAFEATLGRPVDPQSDEDTKLWGIAWEIAIAAEFRN